MKRKLFSFEHLRTGSAASLIERYSTNSSQYEKAIEEINRKFGNPKLVVAAYIKQLEDFERPNLLDSLSFVRYSTFLRKLVHNFEANGHKSDVGSASLSRIECSMLPPAILLKWEEFCVLHNLEYATLSDFSNWLNNSSNACEDLQIEKFPVVKTMPYQQQDNKKLSFLQKNFRKKDPINRKFAYRSFTKSMSFICPIDQGNHFWDVAQNCKTVAR